MGRGEVLISDDLASIDMVFDVEVKGKECELVAVICGKGIEGIEPWGESTLALDKLWWLWLRERE